MLREASPAQSSWLGRVYEEYAAWRPPAAPGTGAASSSQASSRPSRDLAHRPSQPERAKTAAPSPARWIFSPPSPNNKKLLNNALPSPSARAVPCLLVVLLPPPLSPPSPPRRHQVVGRNNFGTSLSQFPRTLVCWQQLFHRCLPSFFISALPVREFLV
ncbi:hypothetical protein VTO42DRAFT_6945 [Malbranchea cinnamomea]